MINRGVEAGLWYAIANRIEQIGFKVEESDGYFTMKKKNREWEVEFAFDYSMGVFYVTFVEGYRWLFLKKTIAKFIMEELESQCDNAMLLFNEYYDQIEMMCDQTVPYSFPVIAMGEKAKYLLEMMDELSPNKGYYNSRYRVDGYTPRILWGRDPRIELIDVREDSSRAMDQALAAGSQHVVMEIRTLEDVNTWKKYRKENKVFYSGELSQVVKHKYESIHILDGIDTEPFTNHIQDSEQRAADTKNQILAYAKKKDPDTVVLSEEGELVFTLFDEIIKVRIDSSYRGMYRALRKPSEIRHYFMVDCNAFKVEEHFIDSLEHVVERFKREIDEVAKEKRLKLLYDTNRNGAITALVYEMGFREQVNIVTSLTNEHINKTLMPYYRNGGKIHSKQTSTRFEHIDKLLIYRREKELVIEEAPDQLLNQIYA